MSIKAYKQIHFRCAFIVLFESETPLVKQDYLLSIEKDKISAVKPWKDLASNEIPQDYFHYKNQIAIPGLINAHTHLPMSLLKGIADDEVFEKWLFENILPIEQKLVDPDFVRTGTELSCFELIQSGTTTVCDMYYFINEIAETLDSFGLRGIVSQGILDFPTPDNPKNDGKSFEHFKRLYQKYKSHPRIIAALAPHAPYSCSDETIKKVLKLNQEYPSPLVTHLAETKKEVDDSIKAYGKTPVARFYELGLLSEKTICAHSVHLNAEDIALLKKSKASVVYNPESNMKLGSGIAPIPQYLKEKIPVGLGTDGSASNNDLSLFGEMDTGAKLQKLAHASTTALSAKEVFTMATLGGAKALGLEKKVGSLEKGKQADLVFVDLSHPHLQPWHDALSLLVYSAKGTEVSTVLCDGAFLKKDGKIIVGDFAKTHSKVLDYQAKIKEILQG